MSIAAVHIKTNGFHCEACPEIVRRVLKHTEGVMDVVAVESLGITSVLYDPEIIEVDNLRAQIEGCGFSTDTQLLDAVDAS